MEQAAGIEPATLAWKARVIPLYDACKPRACSCSVLPQEPLYVVKKCDEDSMPTSLQLFPDINKSIERTARFELANHKFRKLGPYPIRRCAH